MQRPGLNFRTSTEGREDNEETATELGAAAKKRKRTQNRVRASLGVVPWATGIVEARSTAAAEAGAVWLAGSYAGSGEAPACSTSVFCWL